MIRSGEEGAAGDGDAPATRRRIAGGRRIAEFVAIAVLISFDALSEEFLNFVVLAPGTRPSSRFSTGRLVTERASALRRSGVDRVRRWRFANESELVVTA